MAMLRRKKPAPAPSVQVRPALGHPGATAFVDELRGGDIDTARRRWRRLPSGELREFYLGAACAPSLLGPDGGVPEWADAFTTRHPDDALGWTLRGGLGTVAAWEARGSGRASTVTADGWRTFFDRLNEAEDDLRRAVALDPADAMPWVRLVTTGRGLQVPKEELWLRYDGATERADDLYAVHGTMLQGLCAKWSGSHEDMFDFARSVAVTNPDGSPRHSLIVDAHLEQWIDLGCRPSEYFPHGPADEIVRAAERSVLHPAFQDTPQYPAAAEARNAFAVGLALCGRHDEAHAQAVAIGDRLSEWPWIYLGDPAERLDWVLRRAWRSR